MQEEIFGPVVCIAKFGGDDEGNNLFLCSSDIKIFKTNLTCLIPSIYSNHISDVVIQRANDVPYGLCASVWSENSGRIHRVASKLQVWLSILGI